MKDKERILLTIITRIIPGIMYLNKSEYIESHQLDNSKLEKGDLVFAVTSLNIHEFIVGFVESAARDHVVIREIGSKKLCNYYNEAFYRINKKKLGFEILEGIEYETYLKVLKAFDKYAEYGVKFKNIRFENEKCFVQSRRMFSSEIEREINFEFNSKTTIKSIGNLLTKTVLEGAIAE